MNFSFKRLLRSDGFLKTVLVRAWVDGKKQIAFGDFLVGLVADWMDHAHLQFGLNYYLSFAGAALIAAFIFIVVAILYQPHDYLQDDETVPA